MKKLLATLIVTGVTAAAMAQGTVNWSAAGGLFVGQTNSTVYFGGGATGTGAFGNTVASSSTLYYYELLVSPSSSTVPGSIAGLSSWLDTGLEAQNGTSANGRIIQLASNTQAVANNWAVGATENIIMVGWSANLGTTWSAALNVLQAGSWGANSFFGIGSSVGDLTIGNANPGITVLGVGAGQINNGSAAPMQMDLLPVPEPGTMALAALGGLSLLAFRRKK